MLNLFVLEGREEKIKTLEAAQVDKVKNDGKKEKRKWKHQSIRVAISSKWD